MKRLNKLIISLVVIFASTVPAFASWDEYVNKKLLNNTDKNGHEFIDMGSEGSFTSTGNILIVCAVIVVVIALVVIIRKKKK